MVVMFPTVIVGSVRAKHSRVGFRSERCHEFHNRRNRQTTSIHNRPIFTFPLDAALNDSHRTWNENHRQSLTGMNISASSSRLLSTNQHLICQKNRESPLEAHRTTICALISCRETSNGNIFHQYMRDVDDDDSRSLSLCHRFSSIFIFGLNFDRI